METVSISSGSQRERERERESGGWLKKEICVLYSGQVQLPFLFVLNNVAADH